MTETSETHTLVIKRRKTNLEREEAETAAQREHQRKAFEAYERGEPYDVWGKPSPEGYEVRIYHAGTRTRPMPPDARIKRAKTKPGEDTSRQSRRSYSFGTDGTAPATTPIDPEPDPFAQIAAELGATERRRAKRVYTFGTG